MMQKKKWKFKFLAHNNKNAARSCLATRGTFLIHALISKEGQCKEVAESQSAGIELHSRQSAQTTRAPSPQGRLCSRPPLGVMSDPSTTAVLLVLLAVHTVRL